MKLQEWKKSVGSDAFIRTITPLYGNKAGQNIERFEKLLDLFEETFQSSLDDEIALFSAPGRTEIGGNHTDHQHGKVLAASVDMDMIAAACTASDGYIRVLSEGYPLCTISIEDLSAKPAERETTAALIRGIAAAFVERGCALGGLKAVVKSSVLPGSGISSSAAFEVLIGNILNGLYFESRMDAVEIAQIGQYAENQYFGKPSGLMDQMASSVGNILTIDFEDEKKPVVKKRNVDFEKSGFALCIIDSGADHADLTDEYAAIPGELREVCSVFGKKYLRDIPEQAFLERLPEIRKKAGDRAVLRALHVYQENKRVEEQAEALENGDTQRFLELVRLSGYSSFMYLQNIVPCGSVKNQEMGIALAVCDTVLGDKGAFRVHGGGFAGTVQAFVPLNLLEEFRERTEQLLGKGCCHILQIRSAGGVQIRI